MNDAMKAVELLDEEMLKFVETETGFNREAIEQMDDEAFADLYDTIADIEIEETPEGDDEPSERCKKASDFITIVGNAIYRPDDEE